MHESFIYLKRIFVLFAVHLFEMQFQMYLQKTLWSIVNDSSLFSSCYNFQVDDERNNTDN